jgi:hypothetical protein
MRHQDDRLGTIIQKVVDGWKSGDNSLWISDDSILHGYVEVNSHEDSRLLDEVWDVVDSELL